MIFRELVGCVLHVENTPTNAIKKKNNLIYFFEFES